MSTPGYVPQRTTQTRQTSRFDSYRPRAVSGGSSLQPLKSEKADPPEEHAPSRRQPGSFSPGDAIRGGARASGLKAEVAGCSASVEVLQALVDDSRIFDARDAVQGCTNAARAGWAGAATLTAPPQGARQGWRASKRVRPLSA